MNSMYNDVNACVWKAFTSLFFIDKHDYRNYKVSTNLLFDLKQVNAVYTVGIVHHDFLPHDQTINTTANS